MLVEMLSGQWHFPLTPHTCRRQVSLQSYLGTVLMHQIKQIVASSINSFPHLALLKYL